MAEQTLGQQLYDAGWNQGVLLPPLCWSVVYHADDPLTAIAKAASRQGQQSAGGDVRSIPRHEIATGLIKPRDYLVVVSQACDIVKSPGFEPNITAMRAFETNNAQLLESAGSNSARYFLLDPTRPLVVDATVAVLIEKPVLLTLTPQQGTPDETTRRRLAEWLARRYNRPALEEQIVYAVQKPILDNLRKMREDGDDLRALAEIREVRIAHLKGLPPYEVRLLFIVPQAGLADSGHALAQLVGRISAWFDPRLARLAAWDALDLYQISVGDYLETDRLYLDHYTYRGQTTHGLEPPSPV